MTAIDPEYACYVVHGYNAGGDELFIGEQSTDALMHVLVPYFESNGGGIRAAAGMVFALKSGTRYDSGTGRMIRNRVASVKVYNPNDGGRYSFERIADRAGGTVMERANGTVRRVDESDYPAMAARPLYRESTPDRPGTPMVWVTAETRRIERAAEREQAKADRLRAERRAIGRALPAVTLNGPAVPIEPTDTGRAGRRAAHPVAVATTDRPPLEGTEAEALERDRQAKERTRPVTAELVRNRATRETVVWMLGADATLQGTAHVIRLDDVRDDVPQHEAEDAAANALRKHGFRIVPGWTWTEVGAETARRRWRLAIEPTAEYLAYVERRYGPRPEIPEVKGTTITPRAQRGWWDVVTADGQRLALNWSPTLGGDRWCVWGGPTFSDLVSPSTTSLDEALYPVRNPFRIRPRIRD